MIILASTSPRRKQLLKQLGIDFIAVGSNVEEILNPRLKPRRQAEVLSLQKAEAVVSNYPESIIIAADSLINFADEVFVKPKDEKDARQMLCRLSGNTHSICTGITIIDTRTKKKITKSIETRVTFKKLTPKEISAYLQTKEPYDKAGAYAIQGLGSIFVERIDGDYFGAVGLPLNLLAKELKKLGVSVL